MLKRFLLNALSSFVGAWAAFVLIAVACVLLIVGALSSVTTVPSERLTGNSVLRLRLSGTIDERENRPMVDYSTLMTGKLDVPQSLKSITEAINKAANIDDIDAIFIECQGVAAGPATLNAIRNSLMEFKKSGKKIIAYGDNLTMGDYFIASAADDIYLNPAGSLDLHGINGTTMFFKDFLDIKADYPMNLYTPKKLINKILLDKKGRTIKDTNWNKPQKDIEEVWKETRDMIIDWGIK